MFFYSANEILSFWVALSLISQRLFPSNCFCFKEACVFSSLKETKESECNVEMAEKVWHNYRYDVDDVNDHYLH